MLDRKKLESQLLHKEIATPGTSAAAYKRGWEFGFNFGIDQAVSTVRYNANDEFKYILSFVTESRGSSFTNEELFAHQILSLWTAYCLHEGRTCDTGQYDNELLSIWELLEENNKPESCYKNFDEFDLFMGQYLS